MTDFSATDTIRTPDRIYQTAKTVHRVATIGALPHTAEASDGLPVVARIPNLQSSEEEEAVPTTGRGWWLSSRMSMRLLITVAALLLVAAIAPFLFQKKDATTAAKDAPKTESPAPKADVAPTWNATANATTPPANPAAGAPTTPSRPDSPTWPQTGPGASYPQTGQPASYAQPGQPATYPQTGPQAASMQPGQQVSYAQTGPSNYAAAAAYQNYLANGPMSAGMNRSTSISDRPAIEPPGNSSAAGAHGNYAYNNPAVGSQEIAPPPGYQYVYPTTDYPADPLPVNPTPVNSMASRYDAASPNSAAEPGVARFEGMIEKPSIRTTYDRARSSIR